MTQERKVTEIILDEFTKEEWNCFSGAESWDNGDAPLFGEVYIEGLDFVDNNKVKEMYFAIVADQYSVQLFPCGDSQGVAGDDVSYTMEMPGWVKSSDKAKKFVNLIFDNKNFHSDKSLPIRKILELTFDFNVM